MSLPRGQSNSIRIELTIASLDCSRTEIFSLDSNVEMYKMLGGRSAKR